MLEAGLKKNFSEASVRVEQCPDLRHAPWGLAAPGLCGHTRVLDIGGVPYLMPTVMREKVIVLCTFVPSKSLRITSTSAVQHARLPRPHGLGPGQ